MNTKITLSAVGVVVAVLVGWVLWANKEDVVINNPYLINTPTPTPLVSPNPIMSPSPVASKNVITYTDSGYTPNTITIKKGETVTWKNESSGSMWTASAVHPTHKVYPGTDIDLCDEVSRKTMFDTCGYYLTGESWSFTFNNVGTWGYHNHLDSSKFGKVVVE